MGILLAYMPSTPSHLILVNCTGTVAQQPPLEQDPGLGTGILNWMKHDIRIVFCKRNKIIIIKCNAKTENCLKIPRVKIKDVLAAANSKGHKVLLEMCAGWLVCLWQAGLNPTHRRMKRYSRSCGCLLTVGLTACFLFIIITYEVIMSRIIYCYGGMTTA